MNYDSNKGLAAALMHRIPHAFHVDQRAREPEHEKIERDITEFLSRGGRIERVPSEFRPLFATRTGG